MQKIIYIDSISSNVVLARRKGTRSLRLAVKSDGTIRITVPYAVSEKQAISFIEQKSDWITKHYKKPFLLEQGAHIGKSHRLQFERFDTKIIKTRLTPNNISVKYSHDKNWNDLDVQNAAKKACERALKKESEKLLPQRLQYLSQKHSISYSNCRIKKLKSRWGSCDSHKQITLNSYLIQLEWKLIDYVLLHELAHTKHQHHQSEFWSYLTMLLPDCRERRKELKQMATDILPTLQ